MEIIRSLYPAPGTRHLAAMKGVEVTNRNAMRTGEVPKLNSKQPSARKANQAARDASAIHLWAESCRRSLQVDQPSAAMSHTQEARQGNPRSAPNWRKSL